jgi:protease I
MTPEPRLPVRADPTGPAGGGGGDLSGARVAVLVESQYIPGEIAAYRERFAARGAKVDLVSRLWGSPSLRCVSEVEDPGVTPEVLEVGIDVESIDVRNYAAVIAAANYISVRLRYFDPPPGPDGAPLPVSPDMVGTPPAVRFFAAAMAERDVVKGALCHGLWLLTPMPHLLRGRRVICHTVLLADVVNAGGDYVARSGTPSPLTPAPGVVVDDDLVTGDSWHVVDAFIDAIAAQIVRRRRRPAHAPA